MGVNFTSANSCVGSSGGCGARLLLAATVARLAWCGAGDAGGGSV